MAKIDYETNWLQKPNIDNYSNCFIGGNQIGNGGYAWMKQRCHLVNYNHNNPLKYSFNSYYHDKQNDEQIAIKLELI